MSFLTTPPHCKCGSYLLKVDAAHEKALSFLDSKGTLHGIEACGWPVPKLTGEKHDEGKAPWHLLPWRPVADIVEVLRYGANKYAPNNWKSVSNPRTRYFSAAQRHLVAWYGGEARDPESGLPHLAHAACCLLFLAWFDEEVKE